MTDTTVIIGRIQPLATPANKSPGRYRLLQANEYFKINVASMIADVSDGRQLSVDLRL